MGAVRILSPFFLLLLASSAAQQASTSHFKIEGTVINSITGKPLPRALVQMTDRAVLTGSEGEFSFDGVPPGENPIAASKPGYFALGTKSRFSQGTMIEIGPDTGKIVLKLSPEAVIFGHVTGDDGEPLEGAAIEVFTLAFGNGQTLWQPAGGKGTDEDGNYRIAGLRPGRYAIAVKTGNLARRILGAQTTKASEAYPLVVYYPHAEDLAAATVKELVPGERVEASFSVSLLPAFRLSGSVATQGEWTQVNSPILFDDMNGILVVADRFDAQTGSFDFRSVPAGSYRLRCSGLDSENHSEYVERRLTVTQPVTNVKLTLKHWPRIPVEFLTEFNQPRNRGTCNYNVAGKNHQADCSDFPAAFVQLIAVGSSHQFLLQWRPPKDPSGFGIFGVAPGKYMVRAWPAGLGYVHSLRSANLDLLREELIVPEEGGVAPIEVVMRDDPARLEVQVRGAVNGQEITVLVIPDVRLSQPIEVATKTGKMEWGPLPPGDYKVLALDSVDFKGGFDYANPEALAPYLSKAAAVSVSANQVATVAVDLIRTGE